MTTDEDGRQNSEGSYLPTAKEQAEMKRWIDELPEAKKKDDLVGDKAEPEKF